MDLTLALRRRNAMHETTLLRRNLEMRLCRSDDRGSGERTLNIGGGGGGFARRVLDVHGVAAFEEFERAWGKVLCGVVDCE